MRGARHPRPARFAAVGVLAAAALSMASAAPAAGPVGRAPGTTAPGRIVSMNLCADELLLRLADPGQIAAVTYLARDPRQSTVATLARDVPVNRAQAEEIVRLDPDLVIAGRYTTRATVDMLRRVGAPIVELDVPATLSDVEDQILGLGQAVGQPARAGEMVARIRSAFDGTPRVPGPEAPTALMVAPNGFTVGSGSLVDTLITAAGLRNLGAEARFAHQRRISLEGIVRLAPDVLIIDADETSPARAYEMLHHPVIAAIPSRPEVVRISPRLWTCAGPQIVEALETLRASGRAARGRTP